MKHRCQRPLVLWLIILLAGAYAKICLAQTELPQSPAISGFIEASYSHAFISPNNYPDWNDEYLRGNLQFAPGRNLNAEISHQNHFNDQGTFFGLGYTHVFNPLWHGFIGSGTSSGGFFLPQFRIDGMLYRKWLDKKNLVSSVGFTYYDAKTVYTDRTLLLGCTYYFDAPWIVEVGGRLNESNPGQIRSNRVFLALTQGQQKQHYLTVRYETGEEAYQVISDKSVISSFSSYEAGINWRQWLGKNYGFVLRATYYDNPSYIRKSAEAGIFVDY